MDSGREDALLCDVVVIGAGIVGCAVAHALAVRGGSSIKVLLVEQNRDCLAEASAGNSGLFHTGFDATPNTLESQLLRRSNELVQDWLARWRLPFKEVGGTLVAWNADERAQLDAIIAKAHANHVTNVQFIDSATLIEREPGLQGVEGGEARVCGAVVVPGESVVDPWTFGAFILVQALEAGVRVQCSCEIVECSYKPEATDNYNWTLQSKANHIIRARIVVNCAGNYADRIDALCPSDGSLSSTSTPFKVVPRKGQFLVYDKPPTTPLLNSIILPVPTKRTKGVLLWHSYYGDLVIGPTAEDQEARTAPQVTPDVLNELRTKGEHVIPALRHCAPSPSKCYAGLRPATTEQDYIIEVKEPYPWVTVASIRSTGLSASFGIGEYVCQLIGSKLAPTHLAHVGVFATHHTTPQRHSHRGGESGVEVTPQWCQQQLARFGIHIARITHPLTMHHHGTVASHL
eukprot:TRINITY_DN2043_c0_g1_i1.p1 TRINITY_DN2043_c0_g1~~TRINITY_DN2043_c0_g1_i1.p1  ORF type:complete len:460 (-),score=53.46 TRINITY_DN2043_c0_g1_i1:226-1605(-)